MSDQSPKTEANPETDPNGDRARAKGAPVPLDGGQLPEPKTETEIAEKGFEENHGGRDPNEAEKLRPEEKAALDEDRKNWQKP